MKEYERLAKERPDIEVVDLMDKLNM